MEVSHLGPTGAIVLRNADKEWNIDAAIATTRNRRTVDRPVRDLTNRPNHAMAGAAKVLISETVLCTCILGWQPCEKAAMLVVNTIEFFLEEFTWDYQRREMLFFFTTNMAAVTRTNQQLVLSYQNIHQFLARKTPSPAIRFYLSVFSNENYYRLIKVWSLYRTYVRPSLFRESISFVH